jgi:dynein heavy chain
MILVGVGRTGKRTAARAASMITNDIKELYLKCGVEAINMSFLVADDHVINESFLEDVNCILNSGEVLDLFDNDDTERIVNEMRPVITKLNLLFLRDVILETFIE